MEESSYSPPNYGKYFDDGGKDCASGGMHVGGIVGICESRVKDWCTKYIVSELVRMVVGVGGRGESRGKLAPPCLLLQAHLGSAYPAQPPQPFLQSDPSRRCLREKCIFLFLLKGKTLEVL